MHSMHRTKVVQVDWKTGNVGAVHLLLGHTKMDSTVRFIGVDLEDALAATAILVLSKFGFPPFDNLRDRSAFG